MESSLLAVLGTLAGTVFGFGLNEASYLVRVRREERHLLGRVLNELLEIRTQPKMMPTLMESLKSRIPAAGHFTFFTTPDWIHVVKLPPACAASSGAIQKSDDCVL